MPETPQHLIIFVKAPRAGLVKTRLAQALGPVGACAAYQIMVATLLRRLDRLPGVELRYSPDDSLAEIQTWLRPSWTARPQGPGDLGQRLQRAFVDAFAAGARSVAIIGSDCPEISPQDIAAAGSALGECDAVLGPATDGGYWLIGLRKFHAELFRDIPWSTASVLRDTLHRAQQAGLCTHLLRTLSDLDTELDWQTFLALQHNAQ
jgi:rSAM/selenodomain-associated transferase 1